MYRVSDSDSVDSDIGIRYKTDSIRNKDKSSERGTLRNRVRSYSSQRERHRNRSRSFDRHHDKRKKTKKGKRDHSSEDEDRGSGRSRDRKHSRRRRDEDMKKHRRPDERKKDSRVCNESKSSSQQNSKEILENSPSYGPALPLRSSETKPVDKNQVISPTLPPSFKKIFSEEAHASKQSFSSSEKTLEGASQVTKSEPQNEDQMDQTQIMGPALPPNFKPKSSDDSHSSNKSEGRPFPPVENNSYGPKFLSSNAGPALTTESDAQVIGPALPPNLSQNTPPDNHDEPQPPPSSSESEDRTIGPSLPPNLRQKLLEESSASIGEPLEEAASDDEVYGPIPEGGSFTKAHIELEERALQMRIDQLEPAEDKGPVREEWMLTLPEVKASKLGLGPRQFRSKAGPDLSDR